MPASTNDLFKKTGASTVTTLSAPGKALSATSITVGSTTNYPTDTGIVIAIRIVDSNGELVAGTYTEWSATVTSPTTFGIEAVPVYGSDQVYPAGSTTQVYIPLSSYAHNKLVDGLSEEHNQDGTHGDINADSVDTPTLVVGTSIAVPNGSLTGLALTDNTVPPIKLTSPIKFSVYRSSAWTPATNTFGKVQFNTEEYDTGSNYDNSTNYRFVVPSGGAGIYTFSTSITSGGVNGTALLGVSIYKNGAEAKRLQFVDQIYRNAGTGTPTVHGATRLSLAVNDYIEVYYYGNAGTGQTGAGLTWFEGGLVHAI